MDVLVERERLLGEIARMRAEIIRLETSLPQSLSDESMVPHLLRSNMAEADELDDKDNADALHWNVPLPVPTELEDPVRLDTLIMASGEVFCGLSLSPLIKGTDDLWILRGEVANGDVAFEARFQVEFEPNKCIRSVQVLLSEHAVEEAQDLIHIATAKTCLRTLVLGLAEFGAMYSARQAAFEQIRNELGDDLCSVSGNTIKILSNDGERHLIIEWTCSFVPYGGHSQSSEFIRPSIKIIEYNLGPSASEKDDSAFTESAAAGLAALVRISNGLPGAVKVLLKAMNSL